MWRPWYEIDARLGQEAQLAEELALAVLDGADEELEVLLCGLHRGLACERGNMWSSWYEIKARNSIRIIKHMW